MSSESGKVSTLGDVGVGGQNDQEPKSNPEPKPNSDQAAGELKEPQTVFKEPALIPPCDSTDSEKTVKLENETETSEGALKKDPKVEPTAGSLKKAPPLTYQEPSWSGLCSQPYLVEVIKNGVPVDEVKLDSKAFWVVGRLTECDIPMEHPSLSRYHAILQYRAVPTDEHQVGWYLYDMNSTHGTVLNKKRIAPQKFYRLRVGYTFKFGGSSRLHILQGPDEDQDTELTPEDLAALRQKRKDQLEEKLRLKAETEGQASGGKTDADGCSWGMDDDAEDIDPDAVNPFASEEPAEELQLDDPKKALRGWFEREGYEEPEYVVEEKSHGVHVCTVDLPADTPTGHPMRAQVSVQGKKKEAVVQCAMEACRLLDRHGLLRQAKHESRKRKAKNWGDNDFYDSDDDTFLDRTGDIEKKRKLRMRRAGKLEEEKEKAVTYDQLVEQLMNLETEMKEIQNKLDRNKQLEKKSSPDLDDLDAYMLSIKSGGMNATEKTKLKRRLIELKTDTLRLEKLINVAKPNSLPEIRRKFEESSRANIVNRSSKQPTQEPIEPAISKGVSPTLADLSSSSSVTDRSHPVELEASPKAAVTSRNSTVPEMDSPSSINMDISCVDQTNASIDLESQATSAKGPHILKLESNRDALKPVQKVQQVPVSESQLTNKVPVSESQPTNKVPVSESQPTNKVPVSDSQLTNKVPVSESQPTNKVPVSKSQPAKNVPHSRKAPADASLPSIKKSREAPVSGGLAEMVNNLKSKAEEEGYANDPDHITWMPPKGQSGDGKTRLNEKYGY